LTKARVDLGRCQVGSGTDRPCRHPAVVKIRGIPFCEACTREQEAYFTIGELTEASLHPHDNRSLVGMLGRIWWIRRHRVVGDQERLPYEVLTQT
jgi:hypothetical protein